MTQEMSADEYRRLMTGRRRRAIAGARAMSRQSKLETKLAQDMALIGLPDPVREYQFAPPRRWRADFAWPDLMLIVECEGGAYEGENRGRHMRADGFERDTEKYNAASIEGWTLLRFTGRQIRSGAALEEIERAIRAKEDSLDEPV